MEIKKFSTEIGGRTLEIEVGRFAHQADGAVTVRYGETVVLATAVMGDKPRDGVNYLPLMVDYDEKLYAAGKIKGSRFIKREGRPSDEAILSARMVDRCIRPFFNEQNRLDIQVVVTTLSFDEENDPDILAIIGASCALSISSIPWNGAIAGARVSKIDGEWLINPSYESRDGSNLDVVVVGTRDKVVMLEAESREVSEKDMAEAIKFGQKQLKNILALIAEVTKAVGVDKRAEDSAVVNPDEQAKTQAFEKKVDEFLANKIGGLVGIKSKVEREQAQVELQQKLDEFLKADNDVSKEERAKAISTIKDRVAEKSRSLILEKEERVDGRKLDEIRTLNVDVGLLPRTHGSGLFHRGDTQVLSTVTLGPPSDEQIIETIEEESKRRYFHHYNFPGFSVGEVAPMRGPGRREIGHGALAEKAILPMLPAKEDFPYTVRVVSEVLSSNGSSSMASACGSSLALMDAGVPITRGVAGIAMGMVMSADGSQYKILTDIQGIEDSHGDMDFKVAGTRKGVTAIQLDVKSAGLNEEMIARTLEQAKTARNKILDAMEQVIKEPRAELSAHAPRIYSLRINPDKIRDVIGPGGKVINEIIAATGVEIDIEDDGLVMITSNDAEGAQKALDWVHNITREVEVGEMFQGRVTRIMDFGAFVEVLPRQEGLVHISKLAPYHVEQVEDIVKVGDEIPVKVIEIDQEGRINLSLKDTDFKFPEPPVGQSVRPRQPFKRGDRKGSQRRGNR
jgi:polyribonucleotide nucleotidyltransferase